MPDSGRHYGEQHNEGASQEDRKSNACHQSNVTGHEASSLPSAASPAADLSCIG